ncbi:MAG: hypothetical protein KatS3mg102_1661 [Planctomycetota bacterium]|nr:MAG: hypothetical protein KatS3mg102_1661 [Planctomycetota bacterium]
MGHDRSRSSEVVARALARLPLVEHRLANGLRLIVAQRPGSGRVACRLLYRVGSADEQPGSIGIAHLLEHLMFKGTERIGVIDPELDRTLQQQLEAVRTALAASARRAPADQRAAAARRRLLARQRALREQERRNLVRDELWELYLEAGATGLNAYTCEDATVYTVSLPAERLELFCWLESDRMAAPVFRELDTEREIVIEERRLERRRPEARYAERLQRVHYRGTPYRWPVTGRVRDLEQLGAAACQRFFAAHYGPDNAVLALAGELDPERALALAERYFGALPPRAAPAPAPVFAPPGGGERSWRQVRMALPARPRASLLVAAPAFGAPQAAAAELLAALLEGAHGRLVRALVEQQALALEASAHYEPCVREGVLELEAVPRAGVAPAQLLGALRVELERLAEHAVAAAELERARRLLLAGLLEALEDEGQLAERLAWWSAFGEGAAGLRALPERWAAIDPEALCETAAGLLAAARRTAGLLEHREAGRRRRGPRARAAVRPGSAAGAPPPAGGRATAPGSCPLSAQRADDQPGPRPLAPARPPDRAHPRALGLLAPVAPQPRPPRLAEHLVDLLGGRLRAVLVPDRTLPAVHVEILIRGGELGVPRERRGLAQLCALLLRSGGAGALAPARFDERVAELGASLEAEAGLEGTRLELWALAPQTEPALELLAEMLLRPRFAPERLVRAREELVLEVRHRDDDPERALGLMVRRLCYGPAHPAAWQMEESGLRAIGEPELRAHHRQLLQAERMVVAASGDFEPERLAACLERLLAPLGELPAAPPPAPPPAAQPARGGVVWLLDHPGEQTALEMAALAVDRLHPDVPVLAVLEQVLGGESLCSRITARVRADEGLAYGAGGYFVPRLGLPGLLGVYVQCEPERLARAAHICAEEIARLRTEPPAAAELERAQRVLLEHAAERFATPRGRALALAELLLANGPPDLYERHLEAVRALGPEQVREAAARYLAPERLQVVALGPAPRLLAADPDTGARLAELGELRRRAARGEPALEQDGAAPPACCPAAGGGAPARRPPLRQRDRR